MNYGKRFKYYREKAHLTQIDAANKIGIKNYQLGNYETNRSEPSLDVLKEMAFVYNVSIDKLLGFNLLQRKTPDELNLKNEPLDLDELVKNLNEMVERINNAKK